VRVWRLDDYAPVGTVALPPGRAVHELRVADGGTGIAVATTPSGKKFPFSVLAVQVHCYDLADRRGEVRLELADVLGRFALVDGGRSLAAVVFRGRGPELCRWDITSGRLTAAAPVGVEGLSLVTGEMTSPDGGTLLVGGVNRPSPLVTLAMRYGLPVPFLAWKSRRARVWSAATGEALGDVPADTSRACWSPDGQLLATLDEGGQRVQVWNIPPRKRLAWLVLLAAVLAVPVVWVARRRVRRLRLETTG
jgi:hypothetical protein